MKQLRFISLLSIFPILVACLVMDYDQSFRFTNNSDSDVYIYLGVVDRSLGGTLYPDTAVSEIRAGVLFKRGESRHYSYSSAKEDIWVDTLSLFIFDADVFDTYSWEEIKNDYKVLKRYDLSPQDLRQLNYIIHYLPTEEMKNIKMYPHEFDD